MPWDPRTCLFLPNGINTAATQTARPIWMKAVDEVGNGFTADYGDQSIPLYSIVQANEQDIDAFPIWFLPYKQDDIKHRILDGRRAKIMLTAVMSGCTFGIGTRTNAGTVIVSHANNYSMNGGENQRLAQQNATQRALGNRSQIVDPRLYRSRRNSVNFGQQDEALIFGIYSEMEGYIEQGRSRFKHALLNVKHVFKSSTPRWRFYQTRYKGGGGSWEVIELAKRLD